jgi:hypothetical protein
LTIAGTSPPTSGLFSIPAGTALGSNGLPANFSAASPAFSPDGTHIAYNEYGVDKASLGSMDFVKATSTFSNQQTLHTPAAGTNDLYPAFLPTVNPVVSGGYAWVVFTSRRAYGNVATQDPFLSDPRNYNATQSVTTKKLWVAALDIKGTPGTDISHPAFYLPAQELYACNSRGYWVVSPCEANGTTCETGDQCCSGTCASSGGQLTCTMAASGCVSLSNACKTTSDCCNSSSGVECIDGYCAQPTPR